MIKFEDERAFPVPMEDGRGGSMTNLGMTLRDYFAGKAMQGISNGMSEMCLEDIERSIPISAKISYALADAMLAERSGKPADNDEPKNGDFIQYLSVAEGRWVGGKFIGMFLGRHVVGSAEGNVGTVEADQIRFAELAK